MAPGEFPVPVVAVDPANLADERFMLAFALLTLGIQRDPQINSGEVQEFREQKAGKLERRFEFVFDPKGVDGVSTAEWIKRWDDSAWLAANPQHPFRSFKEFGITLANFAVWNVGHDPIFVFRRVASVGGEKGRAEFVANVPKSLLGTEKGNALLRGAGIEP